MHSDTPPLSVIRRFLRLLDLGDDDIREEAELLRLRQEVVRSIRANRQLEADLDLMDLKIGLLVRNRATLQVRPVPGSDPLCWFRPALLVMTGASNRKWCPTARS